MSRSVFLNHQDVRWCPGCGDYAVLKYLSDVLAEKGWKPDEVIVVSGIGCASRLPYYLSSYGFHTIHGRAPTIATGIALAKPDLPLIVITGDGDACSIGLHHFLHAVRRNVNMTILLMNNRVYGLTKGQTSPTSVPGQKTKTDREGSVTRPLCPLTMVLGSGGTWAGRALDWDEKGMKKLLHHAFEHQGTSVLEIYQNCPVFNKDSFPALKDRNAHGDPAYVNIWPGQPLQWGGKCFDGLQQTWSITKEEPALYQGLYVEALSILSQPHVAAMGLFYAQSAPILKGRAQTCANGYKKACGKLHSWNHLNAPIAPLEPPF